MNIYFIGIILLFLSGFISAIFSQKNKLKVLSTLLAISTLFCLKPAVMVFLTGEKLSYALNFNPIFGEISFNIDYLSAFFIVVISIMSLLSIIYSNGYLKPYIEKGKNVSYHTMFLPVLIASMMLVVTTSNALAFLIFWEIMSLSSFFLVIFENEKKEVLQAGIKYLVFMHISVLFIIIAFAIASINASSYDFAAFAQVLKNNSQLANTVFLLAFIGFGTKAGFVPFHNWLPEAHPCAPSHVSAVMSGVMIKTGIYGILRILSMVEELTKFASFLVLTIGVISALYGILYAIGQNDFKKMLAYSSIENIGIIGIGIGVGMLGLTYNMEILSILGFCGAILHILNHSIFKELMFLAAGSVYVKTHTRDMEVLGGLAKVMPKTAALFLTGSVAICALPPFNGFISEFLIYFAMVQGLKINDFFGLVAILLSISALALVGTMAILCFTKAYSIIFLGMPRSEIVEKINSDNTKVITLPMGILAGFALLIGLFPQYAFKFVLNPASIILSHNLELNSQIFEIMQTISICFLGFILFTLLLLFIKAKLNKNVQSYTTWGCGYDRANNFMQYSASSYVSPFLSMLKPLFKKVFDIEKPKQLFPKKAHFSLHIDDIEEAYVINPLVKFDEWFLSKFEKMQSGNIQSYIKYGLIFLVVIIIGSLFIG